MELLKMKNLSAKKQAPRAMKIFPSRHLALGTWLILLSLLLFACPAFSEDAKEEIAEKKFAVEIEYGSATFTPPPLNDIGSKLYGQSINGLPFGGNILFVVAPGFVLGVDYRTFGWGYEKGKIIYESGGNQQWAIKNNVTITQITPFIDLSPWTLGSHSKNSIGRGIFIEIGPCFTTLNEEYIKQSTGTVPYTDGPYEFSTTGTGFEIRFGYRTLTKEPLSFFTRAKIHIPLPQNDEESESGLSLNGATTTSINLGICLSF